MLKLHGTGYGHPTVMRFLDFHGYVSPSFEGDDMGWPSACDEPRYDHGTYAVVVWTRWEKHGTPPSIRWRIFIPKQMNTYYDNPCLMASYIILLLNGCSILPSDPNLIDGYT